MQKMNRTFDAASKDCEGSSIAAAIDEGANPSWWATPERPWFNRGARVGAAARAAFADVLRYRLRGARLADLDLGEAPNIYLCVGFASQGYENWASVESALST